jgi:tetratricopeptide (TPR) repeat protein
MKTAQRAKAVAALFLAGSLICAAVAAQPAAPATSRTKPSYEQHRADFARHSKGQDLPSAKRAAQAWIAAATAEHGPTHPEVALANYSAGIASVSLQSYAEAERFVRSAQSIYEKVAGPEGPWVAECLVTLGIIADRTGQSPLARQRYEQAFAVYRYAEPQQTQLKALMFTRLREIYAESLSRVEKTFGSADPRTLAELENLAELRNALWEFDEAEKLATRLLKQREARRSAPPEIARAAALLGSLLLRRGAMKDAVPLFQRALATFERSPPSDLRRLAALYGDLGECYMALGRYKDALTPMQASLEVYRRARDDKNVPAALSNLATLHADLGNYADAEALQKQSLGLAENLYEPGDDRIAISAVNLANIYLDTGRPALAAPLLERAHSIRSKDGDPKAVALSWGDLARLYQKQGRYAAAVDAFQKAVTQLLAAGERGQDLAMTLNNLGSAYHEQAKYVDAEKVYKESLSIDESLLGKEHPQLANSINNLGDLYKDTGRYALAEEFYQRAYQIWVKALGTEHPLVATAINNLAGLSHARGRFREAESEWKRALDILSRQAPLNGPAFAVTASNLGTLFQQLGQYRQSEELLAKAVALIEKSLGRDHPASAQPLHNLGVLYVSMGDIARALPLLERSVGLTRVAGNQVNAAASQLALASILVDNHAPAEAESLAKQALETFRQSLGPEHANTIATLNMLASALEAQGKFDEAAKLLVVSTDASLRTLGLEHPATAIGFANLASVLRSQRQFAKAETMFRAATKALRAGFGDSHPALALTLANHALLKWQQGDAEGAFTTMRASLDAREQNLADVLLSGAESQKRAYLAHTENEMSFALSLHALGFPRVQAAKQLGMLTVLRRKGRLLEVMSDEGQRDG